MAPACARTIAASEVICALSGLFNEEDLPGVAIAWIDNCKPRPVAYLAEPAISAVNRIVDDSELSELWGESSQGEQWLLNVNNLLKRLDTLKNE